MEWIPRNQSYCIQRRCFFFLQGTLRKDKKCSGSVHAQKAVLVHIPM